MNAWKSGVLKVSGRGIRRSVATLAVLALSLSSCGSHKSSAAENAVTESPPLKAIASIKELMDSTVDPSADGLWNSVWIVSNANGVDKHQPRTDEEWHEVRRHAITLIESMNLAMIPGRPAAPSGTKAGLGELTPQQIDAMVKANRPEFDEFAGAVRESAVEALAAIDHKDPEALSRIGGEIDERCEACHTTFWYPNSKRPNK